MDKLKVFEAEIWKDIQGYKDKYQVYAKIKEKVAVDMGGNILRKEML